MSGNKPRSLPMTGRVRRRPAAGESGAALLRTLDEKVAAIVAGMEAEPFWSKFLDGRIEREEYAYFLVQTFHYVMITPSTYQWALETMRGRPRAHYATFLEEFEEHWKEELGHEHWLLEDLRALGYDAESLVRRVSANPAVEAYVALSRFFTTSATPLALLGQDYFLESLAQAYGERIVRGLFGSAIPGVQGAVKFIMGHGEADIRHMKMNRESVARIASEEEARAILLMAETTGRLYAALPHYYARPQMVLTMLDPGLLKAVEVREARHG